MKKAQTVQRNTKTSHREPASTVQQCLTQNDIWHMGGAVQGVGKSITL